MTQPKALSLAEDVKNLAGWLERRSYAGPAIDCLGYAEELERQHAEIERLQRQHEIAQSEAKMLHDETNTLRSEIERLTKQANAYATLQASIDARLSDYSTVKKGADAFTATLQSERDANAMLTGEIERLEAVNAELLEALHHISLCSQNSMSSMRQCGEIARAAIKKAEGVRHE